MPAQWLAWLGLAPLLLGVKALLALRRAEDAGARADEEEHGLERQGHSQLYSVAAVTIANGADNLGVYIPLFAHDRGIIATYAVVFTVLTAAWCWAGYVIARHPTWGAWVRRFGRWLLPIALVAIGVHIIEWVYSAPGKRLVVLHQREAGLIDGARGAIRERWKEWKALGVLTVVSKFLGECDWDALKATA